MSSKFISIFIAKIFYVLRVHCQLIKNMSDLTQLLAWMKELKRIIHRGEGAFLRCPVSTSVQFSLRDEGSTEYMCVREKITGDNTVYIDARVPVQ